MTEEERLIEKLKRIEAIFASSSLSGEREAAAIAIGRLRERLDQTRRIESAVEYSFSVANAWSRQLFLALLRQYGLTPYSNRRLGNRTILVRAPESLMAETIWPEFKELDYSLRSILQEAAKPLMKSRRRQGYTPCSSFVARRLRLHIMRELARLSRAGG